MVAKTVQGPLSRFAKRTPQVSEILNIVGHTFQVFSSEEPRKNSLRIHGEIADGIEPVFGRQLLHILDIVKHLRALVHRLFVLAEFHHAVFGEEIGLNLKGLMEV